MTERTPDDWYDDDGDEEGGDCYWCHGEGWVECPRPFECTREHAVHEWGQECPCGSCGGSGAAKDMTIW